MAEEQPAEEQPAEEQLVRVRVTVPMSAGSMGYTAQPGETLEVPAEQAAAWVAAGVAELTGGARPEGSRSAPTETPAPRVPRRNASA